MGLMTAIGLNKTVRFIFNGNTVIEFEVSSRENHSRESQPTEFPIESGATINDHVILKPFSLDMDLVVTDNPISTLSSLLTEGATTLTAKLAPPLGVVALGGGLAAFNAIRGGDSPSVKIYNQLMSLQERAEPFTVLTTLQRYETMVISSVSVPREAQSGKCLLVSVQLKQLRIVKPKIIQIKALANPGLSDAMHDLGQQNNRNGFIDGETDSTKMLKRVAK